MDGGLLSLKWNNHRSTFFYVLSNVRKKECYTDVTLACDGKFYPVHKLILSTCSEYFEQMFEQTQCKHPVIVLKDIRSEELESLLSYMYVGEVNVVQEKLSGLIKAAECLRIKGLAVPDEEPQSNKSSGGSREKRTSDNSLSSESKRRRQDDGAFSSQKQTSSNSSREDSNRRRVDQSSSNKLNRNNASSSSSSGSLNSRESRESVSEQTSNKRDAVQTDEHLPSAASEAGDDEIELKAEEPPDAEEDLPPEMPSSDAADAVKQEPIDLDAVYLSDSNSASESKDMLVEDTFGEADGQQHFMDELLGQNSASDQHGGVGDYGEGGEGSSSSGAPSNQQQQHMVGWQRATVQFSRDQLTPSGCSPSQLPNVRFQEHSEYLSNMAASVQPSTTHSNGFSLLGDITSTSDLVSEIQGSTLGLVPFNALKYSDILTLNRHYKCPVCGKEMLNKQDFRRHYMTHSGEKPHACPFCPYRSCSTSNLGKHVKARHPPAAFCALNSFDVT